MAHTTRTIVIHGTHGSPRENWFPWLISELRSRGISALSPAFPTPEGQSLDAWREIFRNEVGDLDGDTVLVGHSLGVGFILNLLEEAKTPVRGSFLVSAFVGALGLPDFDSLNSTFVTREFDWARIRTHAGVVHVYNGDNDPYVPLSRGYEIARNLGVDLTVIPNGGHINASAGYQTFPRILDDLLGVLGKA